MRKVSTLLAAVILSLGILLAGCQNRLVDSLPVIGAANDLDTLLREAFGPVEQKVQAGDGWAVLSPVQNGARNLAYLLPQERKWVVAGQPIRLTDQAQTAVLSLDRKLVRIATTRENAPQYQGYTYGRDGLKPADYYAAIAPEPPVKKGQFLLVNKHLNVLWHFENGKLVKAYRVTTGKQTEPPAATWQDYTTNFFTPEGQYKITNFVLNPSFTAVKPGDTSYAGGAPGNPLGTRWMGFSVLNGDNAWIWGIHGTSHPEAIGTWASDGCIRMFTQEAEELFDRIRGTHPTLLVVRR